MGPVLGPHARIDCTRDTRVAVPRLPALEDGWPGEGRRLTPDASHNSGRPPPPGDGPPPPPRHAVKRYPEPMAHGPQACEPSHPLWSMARRLVSRHTRYGRWPGGL